MPIVVRGSRALDPNDRQIDFGVSSPVHQRGSSSASAGSWTKAIAHLDLDAFFAQAEELDDPRIRGQPVIVGPRAPVFRPDGSLDPTQSGRGIVCTANYAARAFGVRTAMPAARAHRLCPHAVYRKPRGARYRELSQAVFAACLDLTPIVRPVGIDEGYLDLTGLARWLESEAKRGDPTSIGADDANLRSSERAVLDAGTFHRDWPLLLARRIQRCVKVRTNLDVSIGVGPNRFIAKLASDYDKPRGCTVVHPSVCAAFVTSLPLRDLRGVGPATIERLAKLGVTRSRDIVGPPRERVRALLGDFGVRIFDLAHGASGDVPPARERRKSISRDTTFSENIALDAAGRERLLATIARLLEKATFTLRREALFAGTIGVRLRFADFTEVQHERSLAKLAGETGVGASDQDADLFPLAVKLFEEAIADRVTPNRRALGVRLIGVKLSQFRAAAERQLTLSDDGSNAARRARLYTAADAIRDRLGSHAVTSARTLGAPQRRRIPGATPDDRRL